MSVILPRLPSNWQEQPVFFSRAWNQAMGNIEGLLNQILAIPGIQDAIDAANLAADNAQLAADNAQNAADSTTAATALANSYVTPTTVLNATSGTTTATITVSANVRRYGDGTSVSVAGGSLPGLALSTTYYVYYNDPTRSGGTVTYFAVTDPGLATQIGNRHTLGAIETPAASSSSAGKTVRGPGVGATPEP